MKHRILAVLVLSVVALLAPDASRAATPRSHRAIVVGGGLAGLISAYEMEKMGIPTTLLEAGERLGGRVATATYAGGLQAEYGMQEIWEKSPLIGIVKELGLKLEATDDPFSSLIIDGRLYPFVQDTREKFFQSMYTEEERKAFHATLHELESLYAEAEHRGLTARTRPLQDVSFADWLKARHLPRKVEQALRLTIEVELAATAEQFSALSAVLEYRTFLFKGERDFHVHGGNARIIAALAARIHGPRLLGARVTEVIRTRRRDGSVDVEVRYLRGDRLQSVHGDAVVVAVPWIHLHAIQFRPALSDAQLQGIDSLGRGQYTVVHLTVDRAAARLWKIGGQAPFPILSSGPLGVIYGPHATDARGPNVIFSLLIYGPEAQAYHMVPQDARRREVLQNLDKVWPGFSRYVRDTAFYTYHPAAVAFWPPGRSPLDSASRALRTAHMGLFLAGDWLVSSHAEGAVVAGIEAAHAVEAFLNVSAQVPRVMPRRPMR